MKKPPKIPFSEFFSSQLALGKNPLATFQHYAEKLGDIYQMQVGMRNFYVVSKPEFVKYFLQTNAKNYQKAKATRILGEVTGQNLLTSEGDYWLRQRRLIQPAFHRQKLAELSKIMVAETHQYIEHLKSIIEKSPQKQIEVDILNEMIGLTLNVVSKSLFGASLKDEEAQIIGQAADSFNRLVVARLRNPLALPWLYLTGKLNYYKNQAVYVDQLIYRIIDERQKKLSEREDLLSMLMQARDEISGETLSRQQLRDESLILFLAGHETSANALTWTFYALGQNQAIVDKILQESDNQLLTKSIDFSDLPKLSYLLQVIKESMRMYPPAWLMSRQAIDDDAIDGFHIPRGMNINLFLYGIHNSAKYWENPHLFLPERFNEENQNKQTAFSYFPFGGGQRMCIGNNFAMYEIQIILVELLRNFKFELLDNQIIEKEALVTLRPKNGLKMTVSLR